MSPPFIRRLEGRLWPFDQLDFLYTPSADVAADARWFTEVLGGRLVFAIEAMGARVAMVELTEGPPHVLLTDHLEGDRPVFVYRVASIEATLAGLEERGWERVGSFEIPQGPCCSFRGPGGHRIAVYEVVRPGVSDHFTGRFDF
jgi:hypothetical protein